MGCSENMGCFVNMGCSENMGCFEQVFGWEHRMVAGEMTSGCSDGWSELMHLVGYPV